MPQDPKDAVRAYQYMDLVTKLENAMPHEKPEIKEQMRRIYDDN